MEQKEITLNNGRTIKYSINAIRFDEQKAMYSENPPEKDYSYEELIKEDRQYWLEKNNSNPEENFDILRSGKDKVLFIYFIINGKAVSHFAIQFALNHNQSYNGYIFWLYTMKEWRNQGITTFFLNKVLSTLRTYRELKVGLRVDERDKIARRLYENLGFEGGETEIYVEPSDYPEVEYVKILEPVVKS